MGISADLVKKLREATAIGIMDCKAALIEAGGDLEKATNVLRKKGLASAKKRTGRQAMEGIIASYIHHGDKIGVLVEINCETDFVARTDEFKDLARNIAMHVAATNPSYISKEDVPCDVIEKEREIYGEQSKGKPERAIEKIVNGKLEKFFSQFCLLQQTFIKDSKMSVSEYIVSKVAKLGENIKVRRFTRYQLGG
ncbi:MAG: translation elongation factor Ts [bacterium]|nr:translation elongation factor Ts [bacterium]